MRAFTFDSARFISVTQAGLLRELHPLALCLGCTQAEQLRPGAPFLPLTCALLEVNITIRRHWGFGNRIQGLVLAFG